MMTPQQKRTLTHDSWTTVSRVTRKQYLGKFKRLTRLQTLWITSLLNAWGDMYGGNTDGKLKCSGGGGVWGQIMPEQWDDESAARIVKVMADLRALGYRGEEQLKKATTILWPQRSLESMLVAADAGEECDFMEKAVLASMKHDNPVYVIGKLFYSGRNNTVSVLGRYMQNHYAPWLTRDQVDDRVRWCIEIFNSSVFFAVRAAICIENAEDSKNNLKIAKETA
ncbi:hypothetical protein SOD_c36190 [Serratia plymuthica 4Rx13]|uniref:Uncharacterized protein n=1 Tax=Serratia plymuthica TaxID=82996 RepID=A0A318NRI6_SERPL|nr:hypothetical protein [Serratia plymuthica]AGO56577.1 hypothetical protein SOD_c36190 [Serratia plymuthica 4Rx13]PYD36431.1 hypothetical protein CT690_24145 [Serratia plymuthica]